jgi:hypothetical protein
MTSRLHDAMTSLRDDDALLDAGSVLALEEGWPEVGPDGVVVGVRRMIADVLLPKLENVFLSVV